MMCRAMLSLLYHVVLCHAMLWWLLCQIQEKIDHLNHCLEQLLQTWEQRRLLYDQSLDLLVSSPQ